jgi:hypothetical protein
MSRRLYPRLGLVVLAVIVASIVVQAAAANPLDHPWTGSGTGTATVVSDGTTPPAVFSYDAIGFFDGAWDFHTVASSTRTENLSWNYTGFHSFFEVTVGLEAYVTDGGTTTTTPLVSAGPADCCTAPSGGFTYSGTVSLPVQAGDTYGFAMQGSNDDSIMTLQGTLTVDDTPAQKITDLQTTVSGMGLPKGLTTALNAKLQDALTDLAAGDTQGTCDSLQAFLNQVKAQTGKQLTSIQAQQLTAAVNDIQTQLGC